MIQLVILFFTVALSTFLGACLCIHMMTRRLRQAIQKFDEAGL